MTDTAFINLSLPGRFTELLKVRAGRNISLLFKSSNMMEDGKWMFMAGSSDESFFQVKAPTTFSIYDSRVGRFVRKGLLLLSLILFPKMFLSVVNLS